jgi:hypothetical protein
MPKRLTPGARLRAVLVCTLAVTAASCMELLSAPSTSGRAVASTTGVLTLDTKTFSPSGTHFTHASFDFSDGSDTDCVYLAEKRVKQTAGGPAFIGSVHKVV